MKELGEIVSGEGAHHYISYSHIYMYALSFSLLSCVFFSSFYLYDIIGVASLVCFTNFRGKKKLSCEPTVLLTTSYIPLGQEVLILTNLLCPCFFDTKLVLRFIFKKVVSNHIYKNRWHRHPSHFTVAHCSKHNTGSHKQYLPVMNSTYMNSHTR
jgi:hypothetical protein